MKAIEMTGKEFGRWTVLLRDETKPTHWICKCSCGTIKPVFGGNLRNGTSKSCGCLSAELASVREKTHGMYGNREWKAWRSMKNRAHEYTSSHSFYYKELGIGVCKEWVDSFEQFFEDMGTCPEGYTLDRIDNRLGYFRENCQWATMNRKANNRRKNTRNTSGRIGVYWRKDKEVWRVVISVDGKRHNIGTFKNYESACDACEEAELRLLGYSRKDY